MNSIKCSDMHLLGRYSFKLKNSEDYYVGQIVSFKVVSLYDEQSRQLGPIDVIQFTFESNNGDIVEYTSHDIDESTIMKINS